MTHDELIAALEALQTQVATLLAAVVKEKDQPSPFSGGGPGEEK